MPTIKTPSEAKSFIQQVGTALRKESKIEGGVVGMFVNGNELLRIDENNNVEVFDANNKSFRTLHEVYVRGQKKGQLRTSFDNGQQDYMRYLEQHLKSRKSNIKAVEYHPVASSSSKVQIYELEISELI